MQYLHGIPTGANNLALVLTGALTGLVLGAGCGLATVVKRRADGAVIAKAGPVAALLWIAGVSARLAFSEYATHGGQGAIGRFSAAHHITSGEAWVACLVLMALAEVVSRTAVIATRFARLGGNGPAGAGRTETASASQTRPVGAMMELRGRWS